MLGKLCPHQFAMALLELCGRDTGHDFSNTDRSSRNMLRKDKMTIMMTMMMMMMMIRADDDDDDDDDTC